MYRNMFRDQGYRRSVRDWNAVDVMGKEGRLHHGTVIGADPDVDGLLIDFGYHGQRCQTVPYGQAYSDYSIYYSRSQMTEGCAVEVLWRDGPQRPWVWRPATLLTTAMPLVMGGCFMLVELHSGGCHGDHLPGRQLVDGQQVRPPSSPAVLQARAIQKGDFVVRSCALPRLPPYLAALLPTSSLPWKVFCQRLSDKHAIAPISASRQKFLLLQRTAASSALPWYKLDNVLRRARGYTHRVMEKRAVVLARGSRFCWELVERGWPVAEYAGDTEWVLSRLPKHLLHAVLTSGDTLERVRMRRVCRAFDELTSLTLSVDIRLTCRPCRHAWPAGRCSYYCESYPNAAVLFRCLTDRTRRISLAHGGEYSVSELLHLLRVGVQLGLCAADQPVLVVALHCDIGNEAVGFRDYVKALVQYVTASCCQKLLVKRCTLSYITSKPFTGLYGLHFSGTVGRRSVAGDLHQLLEDHLPDFGGQGIREWVARALRLESRDCGDILIDLSSFTYLDSRPVNAYAGHTWTEENLASLNVARLTRLAQYALSRFVPVPNALDHLPFADHL